MDELERALLEIEDGGVKANEKLDTNTDPTGGLARWKESVGNTDIPDDELRNTYTEAAKLANSPIEVPKHKGWEPTPDAKRMRTDELHLMPEFVNASKTWYKGMFNREWEGTDEELAKLARKQMSMFNWSVTAALAASKHAQMTAPSNPEYPQALLDMLAIYDWAESGDGDFGNAVSSILFDPVTYATGGVSAVGGAALGKKLGGAILKKELTTALKAGTVSGAAGGGEAAVQGGAQEFAQQRTEIAAGAREDYDSASIAGQAALSGTIGLAGGFGLGYGAGKLADVLRTRLGADPPPARKPNEPGAPEPSDGTPPPSSQKAAPPSPGDEGVPGTKIDGSPDVGTGDRWPTGEPVEYNYEGDAFKPRPKLEYSDTPEKKYIRFGDVPEDGRSEVGALTNTFSTRLPGTKEKGTSVYPVEYDEATNRWVIKLDEVEDSGIASLDELTFDQREVTSLGPNNNRRPIWLMTGDEVNDLGTDGEPLLKPGTARKLAQLKPNDLFAEKYWDPVDQMDRTNSPSAFDPTRKKGMTEADEVLKKIDEVNVEEPPKAFAEVQEARGTMRGTSVLWNDKEWEVIGKQPRGGWLQIRAADGEEANVRFNQVVVTALAEEMRSGKTNLKFFDDPDTREIMRLLREVEGGAPEHQRIPHAVTIDEAKKLLDLGVDVVAKGRETRWTPSELAALTKTYERQAKVLSKYARNLNERAKSGEGIGDAEYALFNQVLSRFVATRDLFEGVISDAGRLLNAVGIKPWDDEWSAAKAIASLVDSQGGPTNTRRLIETIAEVDPADVAKLTRVTKNTFGAKVGSFIVNARYQLMLSSIRTHVANVAGSGGAGVWDFYIQKPTQIFLNNSEYFLRKAINGVTFSQMVKEMTPEERMSWRAYGSSIRAMFNATADSIQLAKRIAAGQDLGEGKVWNELGLRYHVTSVPNSRLGKAATLPVRLLEAEDGFFRNQYYTAKMHEMAANRAAAEEAATGADYATAYKHWLENPDKIMTRTATEEAARMTFTSDPSIYGGIFKSLADLGQKIQQSGWFGAALVPFVRTPANLMGYAFRQTGLLDAIYFGKTYDKLMKGTAAERSETMARITIAAGMWYMVNQLYDDQIITGEGSPKPETRKSMEAAGWQSNSVKIGDTYYSLSRLDPMGTALNIIATGIEFAKGVKSQVERDNILIASVLTVTHMLEDRAWLSTVGDLMTAIRENNPKQALYMLSSTATSYATPGIARDIREFTDSEYRAMEARSLWGRVTKQLYNAFPGLSEKLPAQITWDGSVMTNDAGPVWRAMVPIKVKDDKIDPAAAAIANARVGLTKPSYLVDHGNGQIDTLAMDGDQGFVYQQYQIFVGKARRAAVEQALETKAYKEAAANDQIGPGSRGDLVIQTAMAMGTRMGKGQFIKWVADRDEFEAPNGTKIKIEHQFDKSQYKSILKSIMSGEMDEETLATTPQYKSEVATSPSPRFN
jgi:hypothetical protein